MKNLLRPPLLAVALTLATACSTIVEPVVDTRGNLPSTEQLSQIKVGETTQDDVLALLGTPSTTMNYGEEVWHYISSRTETVAFLAPEVKDRKVVSLTFDKRGIVSKIDTLGLKDGRKVDTVNRETPSAGKDLSILEQLIGNVGRFSKDAKK